ARRGGVLRPTGPPAPTAWAGAASTLLLLNVVAALTAILSEAYRQSQRRLATLYQELERAYDGSSKLNAEIQRAARLHVLGEVVAGITHEIRNALQGAILALEMVREQVATAAPAGLGELDRVEHGCDTALRIVRNVLHTARQTSEEKVPVSLAEIARRTLELRGYDLRREGIAVQLDFPRDFPLVVGNPFRLQQVLLNLLTNAQEAIRAAGGRGRTIAIVGSAGGGGGGRGGPGTRSGARGGRPAAPLRAVLHDEAERDRARARDLGRHRAGVRGRPQCPEPPRGRGRVPHESAAGAADRRHGARARR